jgi:hypothetical protein
VLTQVLSLSAILNLNLDTDRWGAAMASAEVDLMQQTSADRIFWAHASKAELYLLAAWNPGGQAFFKQKKNAQEEMQKCIKPLLQYSSADSGEFGAVDATVAQFRRYLDWWWSHEWQNGEAGLPPDSLRDAIEETIKKLTQSRHLVKD